MELGGSGLRRMTHVKLIVLPIPTKTSLPPKIVVLGSMEVKEPKLIAEESTAIVCHFSLNHHFVFKTTHQ